MLKNRAAAGVLALGVVLWTSPITAGSQQPRLSPPGKGATPRVDRYQVPAGTALLLKLKTPLDSATTSADDQVDAEIWSPVIQNGVELIPVGSVAIGKVLQVVRATERTPIGTLTLAFTIIEHGETGDRAMLTTQKVVFEAPRMARSERGRGKDKLKVLDAALPAGTPLVAMTAEPLLVRIPK